MRGGGAGGGDGVDKVIGMESRIQGTIGVLNFDRYVQYAEVGQDADEKRLRHQELQGTRLAVILKMLRRQPVRAID